MTDTRPLALITGASSGIGYELARRFTTYGASVEGVQADLGEPDVTVTSLMPAPTDTTFFHRAEMDDTVVGRMPYKDDPAEVARQGFDALMRGDQKVVAGEPGAARFGQGGRQPGAVRPGEPMSGG